MGLSYGNESDKIPLSAMSDSIPMLDMSNKIPTSHAVFTVESALYAMIGKKTSVRIYVNGIAQNGTAETGDIVEWIETQDTAGGGVTLYVTNQGATRTSGGTALCSTIFPDSIQTNFIDSSGVYAQGVPTITSGKTVTIPFTKQAFTGLVVLSLNVLGAASMNSIPNGVTVKTRLVGIAA